MGVRLEAELPAQEEAMFGGEMTPPDQVREAEERRVRRGQGGKSPILKKDWEARRGGQRPQKNTGQWSGDLSPEDLPNPGMEPASLMSPALPADALPTEPPGKPLCTLTTT